VVARAAARWPLVAALVAIGLVLTVYPSLRTKAGLIEDSIVRPRADWELDQPFQTVIPFLEPGARIMLISASWDREYGLFNPRGGFTNEVYPWGQEPFSRERADRMLAEHRITDVIVGDDTAVFLEWAGYLSTREFVRWLEDRADFTQVQLPVEHQRLFHRAEPPDERAR
jgi:hypothetical protein